MDPTLPILNGEERVGIIYDAAHRMFSIRARNSIFLSLANNKGLKKIGDVRYTTTLYIEEGNKINIELEGDEKTITELIFSDITQVSCFDATYLEKKDWCGLLVEAKDLYKFSMVEELELRYSLINVQDFDYRDLWYFDKLTSLSLGTCQIPQYAETKRLPTIYLKDEVMERIKNFHVEIDFLPENFLKLKESCEKLRLYGKHSWAYVRHWFDSYLEYKKKHTDESTEEDPKKKFNYLVFGKMSTCEITVNDEDKEVIEAFMEINGIETSKTN